MKERAILIQGMFEEADWSELVQTLRNIERRHPECTYHAVQIDPSPTPAEDGVAMLKRTFPYIEGDVPTFRFLSLDADKKT